MPVRQYDLSLEFAAASLDYRGRVTLHEELTSVDLELDAEGLTVEAVHANGVPASFSVDPIFHTLRIQGLAGGTNAVTVAFSGRVDPNQSIGLYRSPLGEGEALTTQFETAGARRMFPCRDRPDAKAVFVLEVVAPAELVVISNMPSERVEATPDGRRRTRFVPTPAMSTYLLYLGVGPFEEVERTAHGHRVIAATARGSSAKTEFLLGVSSRALQYFEQYYEVPYPLPKLHLVAIPKFLSGAMENWGAIVSSEPFLLIDDQTSMLNRQATVTMVAHEIAHQWFGDLVTMRSWDDLWLNESFATFASYKAEEALFPEWASWEEFLSLRVREAMMYDSLPSTHPIHVTVTDPRRATEFFDEISYGKGAAVLRMLEGYVGEQAFREGVSLYLREHQRGNAEASDLWGAVARTSQEPIGRVMAEWILRSGFPVITARCEGDSLLLEQRRFSFAGSSTDRPWPIPLTLDLDGHRHRRLMDAATLRLPSPPEGSVLVGPGRTGFYRVRYEGRLFERLLRSYPELGPMDRWGILDDAQAFLLAGEMDLPGYLDALRRVAPETHPLVVTQAFDSLCLLFPLARQIPSWEETFRAVFVTQSERLGLTVREGESAMTTGLRERVQQARVALDPAFARELAAHYPHVESLAPELAEAVYMAYAATAGPDEYATLRQQFREAPPGLTARQVAGGLGSLNRDEWLLECLEMVGTGEMQLSAWVHLVRMALWFNPDRSGAFWTFLTDRLERIPALVSNWSWTTSILLQCAIPVAGLTRAEEMRRWVADHPIPETEEGTKKGLDMLSVLARTLDRAREAVLDNSGTE